MPPLHVPSRLDDGVVLLRPWSSQDLETIASFGTDGNLVRWGEVPVGYRPDAAYQWLGQAEQDRHDGRGVSLALTSLDDGRVLGYVELRLPLPGVGELGFGLLLQAQGRGVMSRALQLWLAYSIEAYALVRIQAFVSPDNESSARLLQRLGFLREGVLRSYRGRGRDRIAFSILADELGALKQPS